MIALRVVAVAVLSACSSGSPAKQATPTPRESPTSVANGPWTQETCGADVGGTPCDRLPEWAVALSRLGAAGDVNKDGEGPHAQLLAELNRLLDK